MLRDEERARIDALVRSEPALVELARRFGDAGFELALVGGPVRDALMGRLGLFPSDALALFIVAQPGKYIEAFEKTAYAIGGDAADASFTQ